MDTYSKKDQQVVVVGGSGGLQKQMADQEDHHWGIYLELHGLRTVHIIQSMPKGIRGAMRGCNGGSLGGFTDKNDILV